MYTEVSSFREGGRGVWDGIEMSLFQGNGIEVSTILVSYVLC